MKNMALKKPMMLGEDVVANVGFSGKGITEAAKPEYPYCLKLYLSQQELDMLEIEDLPVVGTMLKLNAKVLVSSTRSDVEMGNTMELQMLKKHYTVKLNKTRIKRVYDYSESFFYW